MTPVPAVPSYITESADKTPSPSRDKFSETPPGHRFTLYLPYWCRDVWSSEVKKKTDAIKSVTSLSSTSREQMQRYSQRLTELIKLSLPDEVNRQTIRGRSIAPFTTGMGIEHPLENGFAFLHPYGLPYLPGSGIKGVLRRAAEELCTIEETGWKESWIGGLFGETADGIETSGRRGALIFWDCMPLPVSGMSLDIMTPHDGQYYQGEGSPHDSGAPTPIAFLVVPAGSAFIFNISLTPALLNCEELQNGGWQVPLEKAFKFAFDWIGFGAKTSVGYGAMEIDIQAQEEAVEAERQNQEQIKQMQREKARRDAMEPMEREIDDLIKSSPPDMPPYRVMINALQGKHWTSRDKILEAALQAKKMMQAAKKWKEATQKKSPAKDKDHQNTLVIQRYIDG